MKRLYLRCTLAALLPLVMSLIWIPLLPERVPLHFDTAGRIDRWGSRWECLLTAGILMLLVLSLVPVIRYWERRAARTADEKQAAQDRANARLLATVELLLSLLQTVIQAASLYAAGKTPEGATRSAVDLGRVAALGMTVMIIFLGNLMPKAKPNGMIGFRCGWSRYNETTWRRSNRFSGCAMVIAGLLAAAGILLAPGGWAIPILLLAVAAAAAVSLVYARRVYREERAKETV